MLSSSSSSSLVPSASQQTLRPPSSTFPTNIGGPAGASDLIGRSEATDVCGRSDKTKCMGTGRSTHGAVGNDGGGVLGVCEASMPDGAPNGSPRSQAADKPLLTAASGPLLTEPKNKHVQTVIVAHATLMADNSGIQAVQEPTTVQRSHHSEGAQRAPAVANAAPAATATAATVAAAPPPHPFHNQIQVLRGVLKEECAQMMRDFFKARRIQNEEAKRAKRVHEA